MSKVYLGDYLFVPLSTACFFASYGDTIDIVFFDITNTQDGAAMANGYKVNVMPTLLFVDKYGREKKRVVGFHTKEQIEEIFKELRWIE